MKHVLLLFLLLLAPVVQAQSPSDTCADGDSVTLDTTNKRYKCKSPGATPAGTGTTMVVANASSTGTTVNRLAKLTGAPSTALITATTDTENAIGIVTAGAGTTGSATITILGQASCDFDNATTAGDFFTISAITAGKCHDAGSTYPTSGATYGRVLSTNGGAGTYVVELMTPDVAFQNGGNGKSKPATPVNGIQYNGSNVFSGVPLLTYWLIPDWGVNGTNQGIGVANQVSLYKFFLPNGISVSTITFQVSTTVSGKFWSVGIYSLAGNLLVDGGPVSITSGTVKTSNAVSGPIALAPGEYWLAWTCDDTTASVRTIAVNSNVITVRDAGSVLVTAKATNTSTAGQLPSTTGTIVSAANIADIPLVKIQ